LNFFEYESKMILAGYGIHTDSGILDANVEPLKTIQFPCVLKAQVLSGKRGKAGGIRVVKDASEFETALSGIRQTRINGYYPSAVLVAPFLDIVCEHYISLTLDTENRGMTLLYSPQGGVDIEEISGIVVRLTMRDRFEEILFLEKLRRFSLETEIQEQLIDIARKLYQIARDMDLITIEINPLAQLADGMLLAADAKLVMDDNALYRQPDRTVLSRELYLSPTEAKARDARLTYVELDQRGNIGVIAGGAGIGMATVDAIQFYGGSPFNFLDLGGGVSKEKTKAAAKLLLNIPEVKGILINIFGGVNDCAVMAEGVCEAVDEADTGAAGKLVVKSRGFNQETGWALYDRYSIAQVRYGTTDDAVQKLLTLLG
jgi:succinyl-CoA synthetase beta subunit